MLTLTSTPLADEITQRLQQLTPTVYHLENESKNHAGYFDGKESHFKLSIVSDAFESKRLVQRHQLIYGLINDLLAQGGGTVHAFSIHAYTPSEWQGQTPESPKCAGQNKV